jgi:hypothetical protein
MGRPDEKGRDFSDFTKVVLLCPEEGIEAYGTYQGYGYFEIDHGRRNKGVRYMDEIELADSPIMDALEDGRAKFVLTAYYDPDKDTFESLGMSHREPKQGAYHDEGFLLKCRETGGFSSYDGYNLAQSRGLDFNACIGLSAAEAKPIYAARRALSEAILKARDSSIRERMEVVGEAAGHYRPIGYTLVPLLDLPDIFSVVPKDAPKDAPGREVAYINLTDALRGVDTYAKAAMDVMTDAKIRIRSSASFLRDGEYVAYVQHFETEVGEGWYEVLAGEGKLAFWSGHDVLENLGIEARSEYLDVLYPMERMPDPVTFELPSQEAAPAP